MWSRAVSSGKYGKQARSRLVTASPVVAVEVPDISDLFDLEAFLEEPEPLTYKELLAEKERLTAEQSALQDRYRTLVWATAPDDDPFFNHNYIARDEAEAAVKAAHPELEIERRELNEQMRTVLDQLPEARKEASRLFKAKAPEMRRKYIGKIVPLTGRFADITDCDNPFALDPTYNWSRNRHKHFEQGVWKFATVTKTGIVLKARTKVGLQAMANTLSTLDQFVTATGMDSRVTHMYEFRGNKRTAGMCARVTTSGWSQEEVLPPCIAISSDQTPESRIYTTIHEFAHVNGSNGESHDSTYCRRFGDYLGVYLSQKDAPYKEAIKANIKTDTYSPPIITAAGIAGERDRVRVLDIDNSRIMFMSPEQTARTDALAAMNYKVMD